LRIETRKRVQTNEAKSKRRRASPTKITGRRDNTPASRCLLSRRVLLARKDYRQPITPQGLREDDWGGAKPKMIEGGLYSVTALRETWARRRCILNSRR